MSVIPIKPGQSPGTPMSDLVGRPRGKERLDAILAQKDPGALIRELPLQDLYYLVKEVGLADADTVVELASTEQMVGLIDLDTWEGDRQSAGLMKPWLAALLEAGPDRLAEVWRELDAELTALLIQRWTRIYNIVEEEVPDDEEPPFFATPDRFYMIKIIAEDPEDARLCERLLDWLYRGDMVQARHTLRQASSEPTAELEEQAYRWRTNRMADLGYVPFEEAVEVYAPVEPGRIKIGERSAEPLVAGSHLPAPWQRPALEPSFLGRVLTSITDPAEAARLESSLVLLFNRVLSADRVAPGDTTQVVTGAARAAATLSLGLETLCRGDIERAHEALATVSLTRLHRLGHTVALQLGRLLTALGARAARLEEPMASIAQALRGQRPAFPRLLDDPPQSGTRPIASVADLRRATMAFAVLGAETVLVHEILRQDPVALGDGVTLGDVGRTATAHILLGQPADAARLRLPDVVALASVMPEGQVPVDAAMRVLAALTELATALQLELPPQSDQVVAGWLQHLARGIEQRGDKVVLDRRFVEGLLVE
jgi:hypothetical protein